MKRFLLLMACLSGALLWSCSDDYDDSQIKADMADLAARIEAVQQAVTALNTDLSTYQGLINALKGKKYIKSVKEENGVVTITYNDNSTDTLTPGAKGDKGDKGDPGDPGDAGTISMPQFKIDPTDGLWYISLDGATWEKILDENGNPISGVGAEGDQGEAGAVGKAPVLGVDAEGYWTIDLGNGPEQIKDANGKPIMADPSKIPSGYFSKVEVKDGYLVVEVIGVADPISIPIAASFVFDVTFAAEESFTAGQTRSFALTQQGVAEIGIERPAGWGVKVTETAVEITAPAAAGSGEITIFASSADGLLKVVTAKVVATAGA